VARPPANGPCPSMSSTGSRQTKSARPSQTAAPTLSRTSSGSATGSAPPAAAVPAAGAARLLGSITIRLPCCLRVRLRFLGGAAGAVWFGGRNWPQRIVSLRRGLGASGAPAAAGGLLRPLEPGELFERMRLLRACCLGLPKAPPVWDALAASGSSGAAPAVPVDARPAPASPSTPLDLPWTASAAASATTDAGTAPTTAAPDAT